MSFNWKKVLSLVMALAMILSFVPTNFAHAEENETPVTYVAKVGDVECADAAAMVAALNSASGDVTVEIHGKVVTGGFGLNNSNITKLSFVGMTADAEICVDGVSYIDVRYTNYPIAYTDLTLSHINAGQNIDGFLPQYFSTYNGGNVTYTNCAFPNGVTACGSAAGTTYTFTNCLFNNTTSGLYSLWVYGNSTNVVINGGTFSGVRGVKMYSEGSNDFSTLSVSGATFSDTITEKAAVVLTKGESVTLTGNTFNNTTGMVQVDGSAADGKTVVIDNVTYTVDGTNNELDVVTPAVTYVAEVNGVNYETLAEALNNAAAGDTITLLADATFSGQNAADKLSGYVIDLNDKTMTLSGNTYLTGETTIKNGNIVVSGFVSDSYLCLYTADTKLTLDDVNLTGTMDCYAVLNGAAGSTLIINDSTIDVVGNVTNPDAMGNIIYGGNVTVDNSTIKGEKTVRGIGFSNIKIQNGSTVVISDVETGLNCATVTVDNSTVTITNATKRAVRLNNNALTLQNGAVLTATGCTEDIIGIGTTDTVSVSSDSTLNAVDKVTPAPAAPTGTVTPAYTSATTIWGEATGNASESFAIKLYSGETLLVTATLNDSEGVIIDGNIENVTWNIPLNSEGNDSWWTVEWTNYITAATQPTKVVAVVDGVEVAENTCKLSSPDDLNKIYAAEVDADGKVTAYCTLDTFVSKIGDLVDRRILVLRDVSFSSTKIRCVEFISGVAGGVTVTNTDTENWIDFDFVTIGKGVTVNVELPFSGDSENVIEGTLNAGETYYHGYDAKTIVRNGGKVTVTGTTILRYNENTDSGIYIYGDGDDSTVEFDCDYYIGAYSGTFYAKDANIETGYFLLKNSYDNSDYADIDMTLDNSSLTVVGTTDTQDSFIIDDQASLTLKNGASIEDVRDFNILAGANLTLSVDETSSISATNVNIAEDVALGATKNDDGTWDFEVVVKGLKGSGTAEDPYLINNLEELIWFRDTVDNVQSDRSNQFVGKYVKLTADIDLAGINWNPIGEKKDHGSFMGIFDGGNHTIYNLYVEQAGDYLGLFAYVGSFSETEQAVIKNLTLHNVTVKSTNNSSYVGGVVGNATTTDFENVHVTGTVEISGRGYIGGIVGHGYPKMDNCHVEATGSITCTYWCSGGIVGYGGEGGTKITNSSVTGTGDGLKVYTVAGGAAAVCGMSVSSNYFENVSATNVDVISLGNGYNPDYCLGYVVGNGEENCTLKNITVSDITVTAGNSTSFTCTDAVATVGTAIYFDLQSAINAGGEIVLLRDVTENITIADNATVVLDLNGKTLNGYIAPCKPNSLTVKNGSIVNTNASYSAIEINAGELVLENVNVSSARHGLRIDGAVTATINGGEYESTSTSGTRHAVNVSGAANVTIKAGTFVGPKGTTMDSGSAVCVQAGATVTIEGGNFSKGKNATLGVSGTMIVKGGTFDQDPSAYMADGYVAVEENGVWIVVRPIKVTYADGTVEYFSDMLEAIPYTTNYPKLEGATITLLADVSGAGIRFMENDMVFDLNGHTYTITAGTGSQGTNTSGFQIRPEVTTDVIFKNGTIKVAAGAPVVWMFNNYATDFIVENVTVDCTNMAWSYGKSCYIHVSRPGDNTQFIGNTKIINFNSDVAGAAINVGGTMTIADTVDVSGLTVELDAGATLTAPAGLDVVTADGYKVVYADGKYTSVSTVIQVSTKAELNDALAAAQEGDTILLTADIDYGTDHLKIEKPIILDLGSKTLTTRARNYGIALDNDDAVVTNGKLNHAGTVAAIKVWDAKEISDLEIDVTGTSSSGNTIDGIVIQENAAGVDTIKNVTVHSTSGQGVDSGIKTYNCGNATEPVIGSMENVNVDAKSIGLNVSALVGTATGCTFKGGVNGVELWIKGTYSASLTLADCDVVGGVSVHDEFASNVTNNGTLSLTVDEDTTGVTTETVTLTINHAEESQVMGEVLVTIIEDAQAKVNGTYYLTLAEAFKAAKAGDTVTIFEGTYAMGNFGVPAGVTVIGEGNVTLEGTLTGTLENITLKNLHIKGGNAQRWAYAKGDLVFENVTFEATSVYALHFDGITEGATLLYKDCTIIGWAAMSGSPASCVFDGCTIKGNGSYGVIRTYFDATIKNCTFDVANVNTTDVYQDGIHAVDATIKVYNSTNTNGYIKDVLNISGDSKIYVDDVLVLAPVVATIGNVEYFILQDAINAGGNITLLVDVTEEIQIPENATVVLDLNNKTLNGCFKPFKGKLTVKNGSIVNTNASYSAIEINAGELVLENVNVSSARHGLRIDGAVTATINGGEYESTSTSGTRHAVNVSGAANVTIKAGTFVGPKGTTMDSGSAVCVQAGATVTIEGGNFSKGKNATLGVSGTMIVKGGTFDQDPSAYMADGYVAVEENGVWIVVRPIKVTYADGTVEYFSDMLEAIPYTTNYPKLEGATITLLADVSGAGIRFMENDMVFDLNGHTYTITAGTGSQGTNTSGFQIRPEVTTDVIFKNGTIKVAAGAPVVWMFNNYATDFIVENVTVDCTNMAWSYGKSCYIHVSRPGDNTQFIGNTKIINFNSDVAGAAINVGGTMTIADTVDVSGLTVELDAGATLTAPEGKTVTTNIADHKVVFENGQYKVVPMVYVAQVGEKKYDSLQAAINAATAGQTVKLLDNVTLDGSKTVTESQFGYETLVYVNGTTITIDFNGYTVEVTPNAPNANGGLKGTIEAVIFVGNGANLTLKDSVGNGGIKVNKGTALYSLIYNAEATLTVENGVYNVAETVVTGSLIYGDKPQETTINGGSFTLGNVCTDADTTKPWIFNVEGKNDDFIEILGGTYNQDLLMNYGTAKDCEVLIPRDLALKDNGDGTWTIVDAVAYVGTDEYNNGYATLDEAFAAAEDDDEVVIQVAGTYALSTSGKNITITGAVDGVVFDNIGAKNMGGANVTFNNVTFDYYPNVNYTGLQHSGKQVYNNCTINGQVFLYGTSETFNKCTFNQNSADAYNVWTYGAKEVAFNECTFNSVGKSVLVYNEGGPATALTVTDCDFIASAPVDGKAAIEIDTTSPNNPGGMDGTTIVIDGETTATGFAAGSVSGETLWNDKKDQANLTVTVDSELVWPVANFVAQIGTQGYKTLTEAIDAAQPRDTIVFLADITEDVTVDTSLTINGADFKYTGTMTISKSIDLTVEKVNFVEGNIVKGKNTGTDTTKTITIKNCNFSSADDAVYAVNLRGTGSIVIEDCTSTGYFGFLQVPSSNNTVSLKNVTIKDAGYAVKVDYSNGVTMENVKISDSTYGFVNSNFGTKTITVKDCTIDAKYPLVIWDRDTKLVNTFKFVGTNDFGSNAFYYQTVTEAEMIYTKYVLADENATLKAVAGLDVTTDVADYEVKYENGTYKLVAVKKLFDISFARMNLANALNMSFAFEAGHADDWTGAYVEIVKSYADGTTQTQTVEYADWSKTTINGVRHYYVTFNGISAKEMTDLVKVTVYNANGEAISNCWTDSVRAYAMRTLENPASSAEELTMIVDMLNYGAAAQTFFGYNEEDLANNLLTDAQKALATQTTSYEDTRIKGDNFLGSNLNLVSSIEMMVAFKNIDQSMHAVISYVDHYGETKEIEVDGAEFELNNGAYVIYVSSIVVADARQDVTVTVYDGETVVAYATDSVESYVARAMAGNSSDPLFEMIMKFADSAYAYLH